MHFQQLEPVVHRGGQASLFVFLLLNLVNCTYRITKVDVAVEPSVLQLEDFILGLAHLVRDALGRLKVSCTVGHNKVFSRDEHRRLAVKAGVKIDFLERITGQTQAE